MSLHTISLSGHHCSSKTFFSSFPRTTPHLLPAYLSSLRKPFVPSIGSSDRNLAHICMFPTADCSPGDVGFPVVRDRLCLIENETTHCVSGRVRAPRLTMSKLIAVTALHLSVIFRLGTRTRHMAFLVAVTTGHVCGIRGLRTISSQVTLRFTIATDHDALVRAFQGFMALLVAVMANHGRPFFSGRTILAEMTHLTAVAAFDVVSRSWFSAFGSLVTRLLTVSTGLVRGTSLAWLSTVSKDVTRLTTAETKVLCRLRRSLWAILGHMAYLFASEAVLNHTIGRYTGILEPFPVLFCRLWPARCECLPCGLCGALKSDDKCTIDIALEINEGRDAGECILLREISFDLIFMSDRVLN